MMIKYKHMILILTISSLVLWYAGINQSTYVEDENKEYLSAKEVKALYEIGKIGKPNYSNYYYITERVEYIKTRTLIPFVVKRDTLSHRKLEYWSERR